MSWNVYLIIGYIIGAVISYLFDIFMLFTIIYAITTVSLKWILNGIKEHKKLQEDIINGRYPSE